MVEAERNKIAFEKDIITILKQCVINCSTEVLKNQLLTDEVEAFTFQYLESTDYTMFKHCLAIIGQYIALGDEVLSMRYLNEKRLLERLQWALLEGAQPLRNDALWIL